MKEKFKNLYKQKITKIQLESVRFPEKKKIIESVDV